MLIDPNGGMGMEGARNIVAGGIGGASWHWWSYKSYDGINQHNKGVARHVVYRAGIRKRKNKAIHSSKKA